MAQQDNGVVTYHNPIIPGFSPDPSVIYVDGFFILVTSSFHIFPGLPIYVSKDLVTWSHIGNAINRLDQLDLTWAGTQKFPPREGKVGMIGTSGLFAPTIRHHRGTYYVVCTNTASASGFETRNFYIITTDIWSNEWSDPIYFDFKGIDPSFFFDDDDRAYVQGAWGLGFGKQPSSTIKQFEIDIKTGKALSDITEIWSGWKKIDSEGPHVYKKDGWYYLIIAEGGTMEHHMVSAARSRNVWGPYESYGKNPILTADGKDEYIQHVGHAELFHDGNGQWWAVALGVRNEDGRYPLGRETFLTPMTWPSEGWPEIEQPKMMFQWQKVEGDSQRILTPKSDPGWVHIRNPVLTNYELFSGNSSTCRLKASETDLSVGRGTTSFLGKRQRSLESSITATIHIDDSLKTRKTLKAGLAVYKDQFRHAEIYLDFQNLEINLNIQKADGDESLPNPNPDRIDVSEKAVIRIRARKQSYGFYVLAKDKSWVELGILDSIHMTGQDFTGTMFGVYATGSGDAIGAQVTFDYGDEVTES